MARRNHPARGGSKKKKGTSKTVLFLIAGAVIVVFALVLFFMKEKAPEVVVPKVEKTAPKSVLPNRPEEVWSYIQALETRTVPVDDNAKNLDKNMRLTEEQKKILLAMEKEQKEAEQARLKQQEERQKAEEMAKKEAALSTPKAPETPKQTKPQNTPATVVEAKASESKKVDIIKEVPKTETPKAEVVKKVEKPVEKPAENPAPIKTTTNGRQYGLQCGAFKNKAQADNLQARLALTGLNARVNSSAEWNRVVVGPLGDRTSAVRAQEKAKSVINCVVIGM